MKITPEEEAELKAKHVQMGLCVAFHRLAAGLNRKKFALLLNTDERTLSNIEAGKILATNICYKKLAHGLGISVEVLQNFNISQMVDYAKTHFDKTKQDTDTPPKS